MMNASDLQKPCEWTFFVLSYTYCKLVYILLDFWYIPCRLDFNPFFSKVLDMSVGGNGNNWVVVVSCNSIFAVVVNAAQTTVIAEIVGYFSISLIVVCKYPIPLLSV